jgi:ATP-binding cassette, subfamily B, multidrug efflux pump
VEQGSHDELMALGGRYFKMYQLQQGSTASIAESKETVLASNSKIAGGHV